MITSFITVGRVRCGVWGIYRVWGLGSGVWGPVGFCIINMKQYVRQLPRSATCNIQLHNPKHDLDLGLDPLYSSTSVTLSSLNIFFPFVNREGNPVIM